MIKDSESQNTVQEGEVETGRPLAQYSWDLFFDPELLRNKKILNLGSGSSNLGQDLKRAKIDCQVIDLDLNYDPYINKAFKPFRTKVAQLVDSAMKGGESKRHLIRKIMGTENRKMAQADMLKLPFDDKSFDFIFANNSTYQLPTEKKRAVFSEMFRVANKIHISPILKRIFILFLS
jgi:hypothetical protein